MFASSRAPGNYDLLPTLPRNYADQLFWRRYAAARLHSIVSKVLRLPSRLQPLAAARQGTTVKSRHYAGVKLVSLDAIRGSESRSADFDGVFRPLHRRMHHRWVNVATAWLRGVVFEPVQLIQIGDDYFVRDGHHRISVALATGQHYIDAEVTILELGDRAGRASQPLLAARPRFASQGTPALAF